MKFWAINKILFDFTQKWIFKWIKGRNWRDINIQIIKGCNKIMTPVLNLPIINPTLSLSSLLSPSSKPSKSSSNLSWPICWLTRHSASHIPSSQLSRSKPANPSIPKKKSLDPGTMWEPNCKNAPKISRICLKTVWLWQATCWSGRFPTCARVTWAWWTTLRSGRQRNCPTCPNNF